MKTLYFECYSGISGDMTVGALLDLGIDFDKFLGEIKKLNIKDLNVSVEKKKLKGICGTSFYVKENGTYNHGHRHLEDIINIINNSSIGVKAKKISVEIFKEIAEAEAKVHGTDISEVHFHEVGAVDSIADIVGAAICIELLGVEKIYSSELYDGRGTVECAHGILPVPVPAVMQMLKGSQIPLIQKDILTELVTPTGMAIIKVLSSNFGRMPAMKVLATGWGFGKKDTGGINALRVVLGESCSEINDTDSFLIEANIDDMSPEAMAFAMEKLFENGALDVFFTPIYMKKNRPAYMLSVIIKPDCESVIADIIFKHTTSSGYRKQNLSRNILKREIINVDTEYGLIRVKKIILPDGKIRWKPEYEDCKNAILKYGVNFDSVCQAALKAAEKL